MNESGLEKKKEREQAKFDAQAMVWAKDENKQKELKHQWEHEAYKDAMKEGKDFTRDEFGVARILSRDGSHLKEQTMGDEEAIAPGEIHRQYYGKDKPFTGMEDTLGEGDAGRASSDAVIAGMLKDAPKMAAVAAMSPAEVELRKEMGVIQDRIIKSKGMFSNVYEGSDKEGRAVDQGRLEILKKELEMMPFMKYYTGDVMEDPQRDQAEIDRLLEEKVKAEERVAQTAAAHKEASKAAEGLDVDFTPGTILMRGLATGFSKLYMDKEMGETYEAAASSAEEEALIGKWGQDIEKQTALRQQAADAALVKASMRAYSALSDAQQDRREIEEDLAIEGVQIDPSTGAVIGGTEALAGGEESGDVEGMRVPKSAGGRTDREGGYGDTTTQAAAVSDTTTQAAVEAEDEVVPYMPPAAAAAQKEILAGVVADRAAAQSGAVSPTTKEIAQQQDDVLIEGYWEGQDWTKSNAEALAVEAQRAKKSQEALTKFEEAQIKAETKDWRSYQEVGQGMGAYDPAKPLAGTEIEPERYGEREDLNKELAALEAEAKQAKESLSTLVAIYRAVKFEVDLEGGVTPADVIETTKYDTEKYLEKKLKAGDQVAVQAMKDVYGHVPSDVPSSAGWTGGVGDTVLLAEALKIGEDAGVETADAATTIASAIQHSTPHMMVQILDPKEHGVVAATKSRRAFFQNATEADWQKTFGKIYERNVDVMAEAMEDPAGYGFESKEEALADARLATMNEIFGVRLAAKDKLAFEAKRSQTKVGGRWAGKEFEAYGSKSSYVKQVDALGNITTVLEWMSNSTRELVDRIDGKIRTRSTGHQAADDLLIQREFSTAPRTAALNEMQKYRDAARTSAGGGGDTNVTVVAPTTANSTTTNQNINPNPLMSNNPRTAMGVGY